MKVRAWPLLLLLALALPEVDTDVFRTAHHATFWHPLGWDDYGRDAFQRLVFASARSTGFATLAALLAVMGGSLLAWLGDEEAPWQSVLRTLPPVLIVLPLASHLPAFGWLPLAGLLASLLALHAAPALRARFRPLKEAPALPSQRVLGASPFHIARVWTPWCLEQAAPLFPTLWLGALRSEVILRFLGLGPGPEHDSLGRILEEEMARLVTDPTPLGIASLLTLVALTLWVAPRKDRP